VYLAAFETPSTTATQEAARLAGLVDCPLIQEPVAASLSYGFQTKKENVYWLVYDFGGGTFDAALNASWRRYDQGAQS